MQTQDQLARTGLNPVQTLLEITGAYALPRCLHVIAEIGVADALHQTPCTAAELANAPSGDTQGALMHSVRTGRVAAEEILPKGFYGYLAQDADAAADFNAAMVAKAHGQVAGVLAACDFSGFDAIGDIGGGGSQLLRAILDTAPGARGALYDLRRVIE